MQTQLTRHIVRLVLSAILFSLAAMLAPMTAPPMVIAKTLAVESLLREDGTLDLNTSSSGTLDLNGWNVALDSVRGPVFEPAGQTLDAPTAAGWNTLGTGIGTKSFGFVGAIVITGTNLYVGGDFPSAGTCSSGCTSLAKWDGTSWSSVGGGVNSGGRIFDIAVYGSDVYIGGDFSSAGSCTSVAGCRGIAKWDGTTWSPLESGIPSLQKVMALAINATGDLYAGGDFSQIGSCTSNNDCGSIAKWNGATWSNMGTGLTTGSVYALAISGTDVYAGGDFSQIRNCTSNCNMIAKWNGTWASVGNGVQVGSQVDAIVTSGTDVYAGGIFTQIGTCDSLTGCNNIAKWNGSSWANLGSGDGDPNNDDIVALAVSGTNVYAGGWFSKMGTCTSGCNKIAKWNGTTWEPLDTGTTGNFVYSIALRGTEVYAGGDFTSAGTCSSNCTYIARYGNAPTAVTLSTFQANPPTFDLVNWFAQILKHWWH